MYQSYKGRSIDFTKKVKIYKNLHNGLFSVMQRSLVVAHVESFELSQVEFKVNEKGRQRVIKENRKNVHAFIIGMLHSVNKYEVKTSDDSGISYNPYKADYFYWCEDMKKVNPYLAEIYYGCNQQGLFKKYSF